MRFSQKDRSSCDDWSCTHETAPSQRMRQDRAGWWLISRHRCPIATQLKPHADRFYWNADRQSGSIRSDSRKESYRLRRERAETGRSKMRPMEHGLRVHACVAAALVLALTA